MPTAVHYNHSNLCVSILTLVSNRLTSKDDYIRGRSMRGSHTVLASSLPLGQAGRGFRGQILSIEVAEGAHGMPAAEIERRLLELGFVEGAEIEVLHEGPFGRDPIAVRVNDTTIALRRREAMAIYVLSVDRLA